MLYAITKQLEICIDIDIEIGKVDHRSLCDIYLENFLKNNKWGGETLFRDPTVHKFDLSMRDITLRLLRLEKKKELTEHMWVSLDMPNTA